MTIASSSGLSDKDIEKMVSDAEQYAETDKARKHLIEEANKADSVCADTEKGKHSVADFKPGSQPFCSYERVQGPDR